MAEFNLINRAENMADYLLTITDKAPKKLRSDIIPELRRASFKCIQTIIRANNCPLDKTQLYYIKLRKQYQLETKSLLQTISAYSEICVKHNYITKKQFDVLNDHIFKCQDTLIKWMTSDENRLK